MKPIPTVIKFLTVIALAVLAVGCASPNLLDKENAAVAAGFKIITPSKPGHEALLQKLPADKVTRISYGGKTYFVLPDRANHRAYVGGPKQYQAYQQFRRSQHLNADDVESTPSTIEVVEINSMNWGEWGGWGPMGIMGGPGWY